jgi:N-formylglutamate amidohydrolase
MNLSAALNRKSDSSWRKTMRPLPHGILTQLVLLTAIGILAAPLWAQEKARPESFLTLWAGMAPIILSAPHGGREAIPGIPLRRGIGVPQFTTQRDSGTDELAEKIAVKLEEKLGTKSFVVIARFPRKYVDTNRGEGSAYESAQARPFYAAYHRALERACDQVRRWWGRGLLLDIHGQSAEVDTIFRGTDNGRAVAALERLFGREALAGRKSILERMAEKGYRIKPPLASGERERRYARGYTIRTYGSQSGAGVDAIQLELGTSLRARANLDRTAADLADAIAVFAREYLPAAQPVLRPDLSPQPEAPTGEDWR